MKKELLCSAFALTLLTAGCNNEDTAAPPSSRDIEIVTKVGTLTRATDEAFETGDRISIYAYETGNPAEMVVAGVANTLQEDGTWTPATPMKWKDDATAHDFIGVYPEKDDISNFTNESITLGDNMEANDLLIATATGRKAAGGAVPLTFDHVMSRVTVNLTFNDNMGTAPTIDKVVLRCRLTGSVNYSDKTAEAEASGATANMTMTQFASGTFRAVTLPQTLAAGEDMIVLTIAGHEYSFAHTAALALEPGKNRNINLTVNGTAPEDLTVSLGGITINDWGNSQTLEGGEAQPTAN